MADSVMVTKIIEVDVKASADASAHLKAIADGLKGVEEAGKKSGNALQQMTSMVKNFIGYQIFDLIGEKVLAMASALQQASDQSKLLEQRMKLVTKNNTEAAVAFQDITDIAVRQGRELDTIAKLYERVQRSSSEMAITQKGVALITEGVAASLRLAGAGTQEANATMLQFSQALASGKLGGDEFRSMMENDSVLMREFAKALGTTMGGLREMSKAGKIDSETLQKALLAMGEDGKNVMQRMIEQAEKLPKTFEQAVTGSKAAFVDLINALQQLSDKSEGIFTKMVERISQFFRHTAQDIRDHAVVEAEIARGRGQKVVDAAQDIPYEARRTEDLMSSRTKAINDQADAMKRLVEFNERWKGFPSKDAKAGLVSINKDLTDATSAIKAYDQLLGDALGKDQETGLGGFTSGKPASTAKKITGVTDETEIKKIIAQLQAAGRTVDGQLAGDAPWKAEAENLVAKIEGATHKLTDAAREQAEDTVRQLVQDNYWKKAEANFETFLMVQLQKSNEREIAERERALKQASDHDQAEVKKVIDAYNKEHLDKDPFEGMGVEEGHIADLMMSPFTSKDQVETLVAAIHGIREKAAKQLLGEKDPLKNVALQMADNWETAFNKMEDDLLDFSKSVKDIFGDMVLSILKDFAKIELKQELQPLMSAGQEWLKNDSAKFFASILGSANGNMFNQGVQMFAKGGVLGGPTPFTFNGGRSAGVGGEAGPEALVPLRRGADGNLGVAQAPVQVVVNNNGSNTKATTSETATPGGGRRIEVVIQDAVESGLGSGRFDNVMGKSYGVNRKGN